MRVAGTPPFDLLGETEFQKDLVQQIFFSRPVFGGTE